jgi:hypothetical protein
MQANDPFVVVQRAVILEEVNDLLVHLESRLVDMRHSTAPQCVHREKMLPL